MWHPWSMFDLYLSLVKLATPVQNDRVVSPSSFVGESYILIYIEARFTSELNKDYENTKFRGNFALLLEAWNRLLLLAHQCGLEARKEEMVDLML